MTFLKDENGQGMVEYALILGLIAVVAIAVIIIVGKKANKVFKNASDTMNNNGV